MTVETFKQTAPQRQESYYQILHNKTQRNDAYMTSSEDSN